MVTASGWRAAWPVRITGCDAPDTRASRTGHRHRIARHRPATAPVRTVFDHRNAPTIGVARRYNYAVAQVALAGGAVGSEPAAPGLARVAALAAQA
ncbi:MAG: hypothetical protein V4533_09970 [Pseudomonadota bacterium]